MSVNRSTQITSFYYMAIACREISTVSVNAGRDVEDRSVAITSKKRREGICSPGIPNEA